MTSRFVIGVSVLGFIGLTLLLSEFRVFRRVGLAERLEAYTAGGHRRSAAGMLSVDSFKEVIAPLSHAIGERITRMLRVSEELSARLERVHSPVSVTGFRVHQVGWSATAFCLAVIISVVTSLSALFAMGAVVGAPMLAFLILEQQAISASVRWQKRVRMELPVLTEQIGMLMAAGWSLGGALARMSERGTGVCSTDLERVMSRIRQGLSEIDALREWARKSGCRSPVQAGVGAVAQPRGSRSGQAHQRRSQIHALGGAARSDRVDRASHPAGLDSGDRSHAGYPE